MKARLGVIVAAIGAFLSVGSAAFAQTPAPTDATQVVSNAASNLQNSALSMIGTVLPYAIAVLVAIWGIRFLKRQFGVGRAG